jgi:hypothetical protein
MLCFVEWQKLWLVIYAALEVGTPLLITITLGYLLAVPKSGDFIGTIFLVHYLPFDFISPCFMLSNVSDPWLARPLNGMALPNPHVARIGVSSCLSGYYWIWAICTPPFLRFVLDYRKFCP